MPKVTVRYEVDGEPAWTVPDAAAHLGLSIGRIFHFVRDGTLVPIAAAPGPGGKKWLFRPEDVERLKEEREKAKKAARKPGGAR